MATPTKNYGLPQWDGNEYFKRTVMNEGFAKVDEALKKVEDGVGAKVEEALNPMSAAIEKLKNDLKELETSINSTVNSALAALGDRLGLVEQMWAYLVWRYDYTCDMPASTATKPYDYTEKVLQGAEVKATKVTTCNADGSFTEKYTIGSNPVRTLTTSKTGNQWKGVWS